MLFYICIAYIFLFIACVIGAFNHEYKANLLQRIALSILAIWSIWRIGLIWNYGWGYPHEFLVATALVLYAIGSAIKTRKYRRG